MSEGMANAQLREQLRIEDRADLLDRYVRAALMGGWIEMTIPDKSNSRLQRYRLTAAGRALHARLIAE